ncbi:hypothetical protein SAMN05216338_102440 [Bradyrhizobium sp. Rc2d]|nr:hypothetical protein SAMN05216338_102440 [Bradyrhizobium sp. Rc2d]
MFESLLSGAQLRRLSLLKEFNAFRENNNVEATFATHGTGSSQGLFERASKEPSWVPGVRVFPNPHNQTLHVAVQWGIMGIVVLYAIWILHLLLFRGDGLAYWIGLLVVVQNIFTSLFNSHLFDFHEGWMYVIGVGVAGGIVNRAQQKATKVGEARSELSPRGDSGVDRSSVRSA